jgi:SAM-dependent methyltransferase
MYGLAGSYAQTLIGLPDRVAAEEAVTPRDVIGQIDRRINVRASGTAHRGYFHAAGRLIARLFDDRPAAEQPRAIIDIGCGDGTWLRELYQLISTTTLRGRCLDQYPLHLIGVDLDPVALEISARTLAELPATWVLGDVGQPEAIAQAVASASGIELDNVLSVRAFVDHNRSLSRLAGDRPDQLRIRDGVYATAAGVAVGPDRVSRDWTAHYTAWRRMCRRHGLVVIEAHTLSTAEAHRRLDRSHSVALQYHHALSGQSPVPHGAFRAAAGHAGLAVRQEIRYPAASPTRASPGSLRPRTPRRTREAHRAPTAGSGRSATRSARHARRRLGILRATPTFTRGLTGG